MVIINVMNLEDEDTLRFESDQPKTEETDYEQLLWQRAEELTALRIPLEQLQNELFNESNRMRMSMLNLHQRDVLAQKEAEYWQVVDRVHEIKRQEDTVVELLAGLEEGTVGESELKALFPSQTDEMQLSKKKQPQMYSGFSTRSFIQGQ